MKLYARLFVSHLTVILIAETVLIIALEVFAPNFFEHHIQAMIVQFDVQGDHAREDLAAGLRSALTRALLVSLPIATLVAAITALFTARPVVRSVRLLQTGSRAIAGGQYTQRLDAHGSDEVADLARSFNQMAGALEHVESDRVALIGNVSHELRTPLAALRGYAEALTDGVIEPQHAAASIMREVGAMERLARDLSLVSRVEAGNVDLNLEPVLPVKLLDVAFDRFESAFQSKQVRLERRPGHAPPVLADFERTSQVLANLLSNALRHAPPGGQVTLDASIEGSHVRFSVHDTGPGIPVEHQRRVFERFYRVDSARTRSDGGSGVGLTIVRGLVERMGGNVQLESQPGRTVFSFTLPVAPPGVVKSARARHGASSGP